MATSTRFPHTRGTSVVLAEGLTSFSKDNMYSANFLGQKMYNQAFWGVHIWEYAKKL